MKNFILCSAVAAFLQFLPTAVLGQANVTPVFDAQVRLAAPRWAVDDTGLIAEVDERLGNSANDTEVYFLEFIPKGESFDNWSELYALSGERALEGNADSYAGGQIAIYERVCENFAAQVIHATASRADFIALCGTDTTRTGQGEVAVFRFEKIGTTLVKIYHHKRGPEYDPAAIGAAFFTEAEVVSMYERIRDIRVTPAP